jgi:Mlc titration factor MtfA (ptsG expression regulator)
MTSEKPAILDRDQCGIRLGEISILMATRGRAEMLAEEIESLKQNTVNKAKVKLWVYVDDDDQVMLDAIAAKKFPDPGFPIHWHVGPRPGALGLCHQALWNASGRVSEIYTISVDDVRFDTHGWDEVVRGAFTDCRDGVLLAFAHDPNAPQATFPYIGWGFLLTLGYEKIFPGIFIYWFDDKWIEQIAVMAGRCVKVPVTMNPIGDKGLTQRMRNVPFWTRFCQLTVIERKDSSQKLIDAMHAKDPAARAAATADLERAFAKITKDETNAFSDIYCIFQEERHTALKPEDRNLFYPLYLKQEATAVIRLLTHAQNFINQKNYPEALKFVECVDMADMKVRAAQDMKINCLRALGKNSEADQLEKEKLVAWPEQPAIRRIFRFLGMVANEGRRMIAGLTSKPTPIKK